MVVALCVFPAFVCSFVCSLFLLKPNLTHCALLVFLCLYFACDTAPAGFYHDANILSCDSLLGIALFVFNTSLVVYAILGYFYIMHSFTTLVNAHFKRSKFVDILDKLIRIREDEENSFIVRTAFIHAVRLSSSHSIS